MVSDGDSPPLNGNTRRRW